MSEKRLVGLATSMARAMTDPTGDYEPCGHGPEFQRRGLCTHPDHNRPTDLPAELERAAAGGVDRVQVHPDLLTTAAAAIRVLRDVSSSGSRDRREALIAALPGVFQLAEDLGWDSDDFTDRETLEAVADRLTSIAEEGR